MPDTHPDNSAADPDGIVRLRLSCGCFVGLAVQQALPCRHNDGRYASNELDLEQVPCGCDGELRCERCNGHGYVWKKRFYA